MATLIRLRLSLKYTTGQVGTMISVGLKKHFHTTLQCSKVHFTKKKTCMEKTFDFKEMLKHRYKEC